MKKITLIFTLIIGFAIFLGSCQKDEKDPILNIDLSNSSTITVPGDGSEIVLTLEDSANQVLVSWDAATYSVSGGSELAYPTYSLELAFADSSFAKQKELFNTQDLVFTTTVYDFNALLLQLGVPGDSTDIMELRVVSGISGSPYTNDTSEIISVSVTTFAAAPPPPPAETPRLWVPGDYQGWSPDTAPNVWSVDDDGTYTGYVYFPEGGTYEFKFTSAPDIDHTNFGYGGEGLLSKSTDAIDLTVPDFGGYVLTCDTIGLTWSYEVQNWGVIGSGILNGDWSEDIDMEYDMDNHVLSITADVTEAQDGGDLRFKFRANDGWDTNLGLMDPVDGNILSPGGPDIPMPEGTGNYTFILDLSQPIPTFQLIKN